MQKRLPSAEQQSAQAAGMVSFIPAKRLALGASAAEAACVQLPPPPPPAAAGSSSARRDEKMEPEGGHLLVEQTTEQG